MKNYSGIDGLVLCVAQGKVDPYRWISSVDYLNRMIITCDELNNSINNLLGGGLIVLKNNKFMLSKTAKQILKGKFAMGAVEWQLSVQRKISAYRYDEFAPKTFELSQSDYDAAPEKCRRKWEKEMKRLGKKQK